MCGSTNPSQAILSLPPTKATTQYISNHAAAICIANGEDCNSKILDLTKFCQSGNFVQKQHPNCLKAACQYCRRISNIGVTVCKARSIKHWCLKVTLECMTPSASCSALHSGSSSLASHSATTRSSTPSVLMTTSPSTMAATSSSFTTTALSSSGDSLGPDHAAAECFAEAQACSWKIANENGLHQPNTCIKHQPDLCLKMACHFCGRSQKWHAEYQVVRKLVHQTLV